MKRTVLSALALLMTAVTLAPAVQTQGSTPQELGKSECFFVSRR